MNLVLSAVLLIECVSQSVFMCTCELTWFHGITWGLVQYCRTVLSTRCHIIDLLIEHDDQSQDLAEGRLTAATLSYDSSLIDLFRPQLFVLGIPVSKVQPESNKADTLCLKDQLKVKCVYFSPGNVLGTPTSLHRMKILWWEQDICSLSACDPSAVDSSALAHLLFFVCVFVWLRV